MIEPATADAGGNKPILSEEGFDFLANLRLAASGDVEAMRRMNAVLRHAALRDARLDRKLDPQRAVGQFERNRAAERHLTAIKEYRADLEMTTEPQAKPAIPERPQALTQQTRRSRYRSWYR